MRLAWNHGATGIGSQFGYTTHQTKLRQALERIDVKFDQTAKCVVHIIPPYYFDLIRFKTNILYTTFEYDHVPRIWSHMLNKAEMIVVPCTHNKRIFSEITDQPITVIPEGVDTDEFPYVKREMKEPFVFLYLGDDNPRKGTFHIAKAWEMWNDKYPRYAKKSILIMKMTHLDQEKKLLQMTPNSYADYRVLPLKPSGNLPTLASLYIHASAFLFPSMGEGWGLPLCEAMATGLPCIYTHIGGPEDFASPEYAYPVEYGEREINLTYGGSGYIGTAIAADPVIESIVAQMHEIYTNYDAALDKGLTAAAAMRKWFTWDMSAAKYKEAIREYAEC